MVLKHIGVASAARITGIVTAALGLIVAVLYLPILTLLSLFDGSGESFGMTMGFAFLIIFPILYGLMGFLIGAFYAWLYNIVAERFGGLEMEFEDAG
ncbi:MAG: hypothetical protein R2834_23210 [Rhodothermales bacterium]